MNAREVAIGYRSAEKNATRRAPEAKDGGVGPSFLATRLVAECSGTGRRNSDLAEAMMSKTPDVKRQGRTLYLQLVECSGALAKTGLRRLSGFIRRG